MKSSGKNSNYDLIDLNPQANQNNLLLNRDQLDSFFDGVPIHFLILDLLHKNILYYSPKVVEPLGLKELRPGKDSPARLLQNCLSTDWTQMVEAIHPALKHCFQDLQEETKVQVRFRFRYRILSPELQQSSQILESFSFIKARRWERRYVLTTIENQGIPDVDFCPSGEVRVPNQRGGLTTICRNEGEHGQPNPYHLTDRQFAVVKLLAEGFSSPIIAQMLNLSRHTVDTHRRRILKKTGSKNTVELLRKFKNSGF